MLASITPLGERGRNNRWSRTAVSHIAGTAAAATAQGAALGGAADAVGLHARHTAQIAVLFAAIVAAAIVLDLFGAPPPGLHRQVAESWLDTYRGWVYGGGFGLQLGLGWATIVTTWLVWAVLASSLLAGTWSAGALVGLAFGLGRGLPVLATRHVDDGVALRSLHARLAALEQPFGRASLLVCGGLACTLVAVALR